MKYMSKQYIHDKWPDSVRNTANEKGEFYQEPKIYVYGFYDGYQIHNEKIEKAVSLIQQARSKNGDDALLQDAIITLIESP